ncbi:MAG: hypothetical protein LBC51_00355 [Treponema sp.]|jgi:hypothetical protein|nr:hypothetical protein [Treponema sp.]
MGNKNLIIPVYLNQKIVFDFIAVIEDGIAQIQTIQRTEKSSSDFQAGIEGGIGTSNVLSFLKINLKSNLSGKNSSGTERGVTEEKVHTPTSLFSKLLDYLYENKFIKDINNGNDIDEDIVGQFVHYTGTLEKNPIISFIESFEKIINIANIFQPNNQNQGKRSNNNKDQTKIMTEQIKSLSDSLKSGNIIDIICKLNNTDIETVLQTNIDYFNNRSMNELIDGKFNIVGKAIKVTKDLADEKINLLRNTSLSMINKTLVDTLSLQVNMEEITNSGLILPRLKTEIVGKSMLIIPIAIYI